MVSLFIHKRVFGGRYSDPCDLTVIENRVKLFEVECVATKSHVGGGKNQSLFQLASGKLKSPKRLKQDYDKY